jgi:hypothetical protein
MRNLKLLSLALGLLGLLAIEANACQSFFSQCAARCENNPKGESKAKCTADHCSPKLASCRASGCWTEGAAYGGGKTCNLKK